MTRTMYDSTSAASIPAGVTFAAGYDTGYDQGWPPEQWARFNPAVHICTRNDVDTGDVLDMESGAASPSDAVSWLRIRLASTGIWKSLYYSEFLDPQIQAELAAAGIPSAQVPKWVAWYNGNASLDDVAHIVGVVAKQYANSAISGGPYDLSVVANYWPGVDPPPPLPPQPEEEPMSLVVIGTQNDQGQSTGSYLVESSNGAAGGLTVDSASQLPHVVMTDTEYNAFLAQAQKATTPPGPSA